MALMKEKALVFVASLHYYQLPVFVYTVLTVGEALAVNTFSFAGNQITYRAIKLRKH